MVKVLYFGRLADTSQVSETTVEIPASGLEVEAFRSFAGDGNPALKTALANASVRIAINSVLVLPGAMVRNSDEVAFLPAVSGG